MYARVKNEAKKSTQFEIYKLGPLQIWLAKGHDLSWPY